MSSSPTAPISTTASSTSSHFLLNASARPAPPAGRAAEGGASGPAPPAGRAAVGDVPGPALSASAVGGSAAPRAVVIACGALSGLIREIAGRRNWPVELHSLPSLLHNRPA